jgi:hypothetical protein
MHAARRAIAADPRQFGRGPLRDRVPVPAPATISDELKLFLTTFAAGFVFVSVLLA